MFDGANVNANLFPVLQDSCPLLQQLCVKVSPADTGVMVAISHPRLEELDVLIKGLAELTLEAPELRSLRIHVELWEDVSVQQIDEATFNARGPNLAKILMQIPKLVHFELEGVLEVYFEEWPILSVQTLTLRSCQCLGFCFPNLVRLDARDSRKINMQTRGNELEISSLMSVTYVVADMITR